MDKSGIFCCLHCRHCSKGVFDMSKLALAWRLQGKIAGFGKAREQGRPGGAGVACESAQFLSSAQLGLLPAGYQLYLGGVTNRDGLSVCSISAGVSEKIATISAATIAITAIAFITIIFGELAQKRIGQPYPELVSAWQGASWPGLRLSQSPLCVCCYFQRMSY